MHQLSFTPFCTRNKIFTKNINFLPQCPTAPGKQKTVSTWLFKVLGENRAIRNQCLKAEQTSTKQMNICEHTKTHKPSKFIKVIQNFQNLHFQHKNMRSIFWTIIWWRVRRFDMSRICYLYGKATKMFLCFLNTSRTSDMLQQNLKNSDERAASKWCWAVL